MHTHRILYRLDFPFNDKICDSPGKVIRTIMEVGGEHYPEVGDTPLKRIASAQGSSDGDRIKWQLQVGTLFITLSVEWVVGQKPKNVLSVPEVEDALKLIDELRLKFEVDQLNRAGFRIFLFDKVENLNTLEKLADQIDGQLATSISAALGEAKDLAIVLQGEGNDGVNFRISIGPCFEHERNRYIEILGHVDDFASYNLVCDIDLSQMNFRSKGQTSKAWIKSLTQRITDLEQKIGEHLGG
jgi:hypothetical protein